MIRKMVVNQGDLMHFSVNSGLAPEQNKLEISPSVRRSSISLPTFPVNFKGIAFIEKVMSKTTASLETQNLIRL